MKLVHTSLHVRDIDKSIKFYEEALGFEKQMEMPMGTAKLVFMGSKDGGAQVELTWLAEQGDKPYDIGEEEVIHLGFQVDNFDEMKAKHKEMGIICFDPDYMPPYFIIDPDGYWLEMVPGFGA
jgi:lactoylglutathione lyase